MHHFLAPGPWFSCVNVGYWSVAWIATAALLFVALRPVLARSPGAREVGASSPSVSFLGLALLVIVAFRWPVFFYEFGRYFFGDNILAWNVDECQMLAGALTMLHDPVPWRSVDPTTTGPLDIYFLMLPRLVGAPIAMGVTRVMTALLAWGTVAGVYLTLREVGSERAARIGALPTALFVGFFTEWEIVFYTSEQLPLTLCIVGGWLLFAAMRRVGRPRVWRLAACGILLGAVPLAKLQLAPLAAWTGCFGLVWILASREQTWRERVASALPLVLGAAVVPVALLGWALAMGQGEHLWQSYVVNNLAYARTSIPGSIYLRFLVRCPPALRLFALPVAAYGALALAAFPLFRRVWWRLILYAVGSALAAGYAIMAPGKPFTHYFLLVGPTLGLWAGSLAGASLDALRGPAGLTGRRRWAGGTALVAFVLVCLVLQIVGRIVQYPIFLDAQSFQVAAAENNLAWTIRQLAGPGESLAIWGWEPVYHVKTGLRQATREAQSQRQIEPGPQREYYRQRYLEDFRRSRPAVFLDVVGDINFGFNDRERDGHETFPALAAIVARDYVQAGDTLGVRIYARRDRVAEPARSGAAGGAPASGAVW